MGTETSNGVTFADRLRRARRRAGLTQEELAERAGLSARAITALERGVNRAPHKTTVELLAAALALGADESEAFFAAARRYAPSADETDPAPQPTVVHQNDAPIAGAYPAPALNASAVVGGFLGAEPESAIVERAAELRAITDALDSASQGAAAMLFLAGEPGVGKTRLAQEASVQARARGFLTITGRSHEPYQSLPYYPVVEALTSALAAAPPSVRDELPRSWPDVMRLLPDTAPDRAEAGAYRRGEEQERLYWSVTRFIQALAIWKPVALLLDDLQWADEASLDLLRHLAQHTHASRVFILGAYRDTDLARRDPARRLVHDLTRDHLAARLDVRRLPRAGTAALVAAMSDYAAPASLVEQIHRSADGNPFFTVELLRALRQSGGAGRQASAADWLTETNIVMPESVQSAIDLRLERLSPTTQDILREASVLGDTFFFDELAALRERAEDEVEEALDEAISAALLQETGAERFGFNHMLTQQALYRQLSSRKRKRLHLAAGAALERLPSRQRVSRAADLAWHFLKADEPARALPYVLQAGDQAQDSFAYSAAEARYRQAVALAQGLNDATQEGAALSRLGSALIGQSRWVDTLDALQRAADLHLAANNAEALAQDIALFCHAHTDQGTPAAGIERVTPLIARLPETASPRSFALVYTSLSYLYLVKGQYPLLFTTAERALAFAQNADDDRLLTEAKGRHALALALRGKLELARDQLEEVARLAERNGALETRVLALNNVGHIYLLTGPLASARNALGKAFELANQLHSDVLGLLALCNRARANFLTGEWDQAHTDLELGEQRIRVMEPNTMTANHYVERARLTLGEGRPADAGRILAEMMVSCEADGQALRDSCVILAERDLLMGDAQAARDRLAPYFPDGMMYDVDALAMFPLLAQAHLALDDLEQAKAVINLAIEQMRAAGTSVLLADAWRIYALVALRAEGVAAAVASLRQAITYAEDSGYPYAQAHALYDWGLISAASEPDTAAERLRAAEAIFARLGARFDVTRERQLIARLTSPASPQ